MKIKNNRPGIVKAAAALLLWLAVASCGNENGMDPANSGSTTEENLVPLGIETSLDGEIAPPTRAEITSGSMGVYKYPGEVYDTQYSYSSGAWRATFDPVLVGNAKASVMVVYPKETPIAVSGDKVMFPPFREYGTGNDLWVASTGTPASVSNVNPNISLTLKHLYARIRVKVGLATGDADSGTLNSVKVEFHNTKNGVTGNAKISAAGIKISDGVSFAATGGTRTSYSQTIEETLAAGSTNDKFDMLSCSFDGWKLGGDAPDAEAISKVVITVKYDGVLYQTSIPASTFTAGGLQAGKQYTVTLKLFSASAVTAESVTVEDWGTTSDAGSGDVVQPESDYYVVTGGTDPVTIGGIKWARSNLVQTGSGVTAPVSLAGAPLGAGSHWNWGMRDATRCTEFDMQYGADPWDSPTPGDDNQDPCRSLGTGWRLPTQTELGKLVDKAAPSGTKVKIGNTTGTIGTKGWCPELKCAVCMDNGQLLALPITGYRGNDSFVVIDDGGYYWSSTPVGTDRAGLLTLYEGALYATGSEERNYAGLSVRCVKDN